MTPTPGIHSVVSIAIVAGLVCEYDSTQESNFNLVEVDDWLDLLLRRRC